MNIATVRTEMAQSRRGSELRARLDESLHAASQPLTAVLCLIKYGASLGAEAEMKTVLACGFEQSVKLMEPVRPMKERVMAAMPEEGAERTRRR